MESWNNFDSKEFNETVCASGASGIADLAPEHMLGNSVMTFGGNNAGKPDKENLADKAPKLNDVKESWANFNVEMLKEQDQQVIQQTAPTQPAVQQQANVQQPVTQQPAPTQATQPASTQPVQATQQVSATQAAPAANTQPANTPVQPATQPINTQPVATAPKSQIINQQPVTESWNNISSEAIKSALKETDMDTLVTQVIPDFNTSSTLETPTEYLQKHNNDVFFNNDSAEDKTIDDGFFESILDKNNILKKSKVAKEAEPINEATSWKDFDIAKLKESIALPGGVLNAEPTEYEKTLDKHNKARNNKKVINNTLMGDVDCGEIGIHDFKDNGAPTDVIKKVKTEIKPTVLKPNKNAVETDQKKKWDD